MYLCDNVIRGQVKGVRSQQRRLKATGFIAGLDVAGIPRVRHGKVVLQNGRLAVGEGLLLRGNAGGLSGGGKLRGSQIVGSLSFCIRLLRGDEPGLSVQRICLGSAKRLDCVEVIHSRGIGEIWCRRGLGHNVSSSDERG